RRATHRTVGLAAAPASGERDANAAAGPPDRVLDRREGASTGSTQLLIHELLKLHDVSREVPDAFGRLLRGHRVLVEQVAETLLVKRQLRDVTRLRILRRELARGGTRVGLQLPEQLRADGEQVAAAELENLVGRAEARAHHLGLVAEF